VPRIGTTRQHGRGDGLVGHARRAAHRLRRAGPPRSWSDRRHPARATRHGVAACRTSRGRDRAARPLRALPSAGSYVLTARAVGYEWRSDTVVVRASASDTVAVALEEYTDALRNRHNCRPHGFRHAGERACVTDRITTELVLDRARDMASPRFRYGIGLPEGDSSDVRIVDDERICERAARLYGRDSDPPRRVAVADAVSFYIVYDAAEPLVFGELNQWLVIDKKFRVLARMAL
jgi:hypothetical protein